MLHVILLRLNLEKGVSMYGQLAFTGFNTLLVGAIGLGAVVVGFISNRLAKRIK
jgi:uncharacterized membrane protein YjjB (DUF3815 family)